MFAVIFEVQPKTELWDTYLGIARALKPELESIDGFVDNIRYRSLTREGWLLSLSGWRDEKALVRWRTQALHHDAQERGRSEVFRDYHLRIGEVIADTRLPAGHHLAEQRLDETVVGAGTTVTLIDAAGQGDGLKAARPEAAARALGLLPEAAGLIAWDVFNAVLTPGDAVLLMTWRDRTAAEAFHRGLSPAGGARCRCVRIIRDYGMFDRREAPQYYPEARRA